RVVAGVEHAAREPAVVGRAGRVEHAIPPPLPVHVLRRRAPEPLGITLGALVDLVVDRRHRACLLAAFWIWDCTPAAGRLASGSRHAYHHAGHVRPPRPPPLCPP